MLSPRTPGYPYGYHLSYVSFVLDEIGDEGGEVEGHQFLLSSLCGALANFYLIPSPTGVLLG